MAIWTATTMTGSKYKKGGIKKVIRIAGVFFLLENICFKSEESS